MLINVKDYKTVALALAAACDGDRVYFPGLAPYIAPTGGWPVVCRVTLFGDGVGSPHSTARTVVAPSEPDGVVFAVAPGVGVQLLAMRVCRSPAELAELDAPAAGAPPPGEPGC